MCPISESPYPVIFRFHISVMDVIIPVFVEALKETTFQEDHPHTFIMVFPGIGSVRDLIIAE